MRRQTLQTPHKTGVGSPGRIRTSTGTERESREIQSRIREVATLPRDRYLREPERYDENVEWEIIAAENGLGCSRLQEVLQKWPTHDLKNAILARAAFQTDFLFWQMLHDSTKDES